MASSIRLSQLAMRALPTRTVGIIPWLTGSSGSGIPARLISTTTPAQKAQTVAQLRRLVEKTNDRLSTQPSPKTRKQQEEAEQRGTISANNINVILPGTLVRPPLSQWPKDIKNWLLFLLEIGKVKVMEFLTSSGLKWMSKPKLFKRAILQRNKSAVLLTAKALHRQMAEALATGDKDTIRKVCTSKLATALQATIDARPKGRRYGWELVEYTQKMWYPSIRSFLMQPMTTDKLSPIIKQVVVAISSKQRRVEYDDSRKGQGKVVPGSDKEVEVVEYIVIASVMSRLSWTADDWKIVGVTRPTSPEAWWTERRLTKIVEQDTILNR